MKLGAPRWVKCNSWRGETPAIGDRMRTVRGRYLIVDMELVDGRPARFKMAAASGIKFEGGREHAWQWSKRRGRQR